MPDEPRVYFEIDRGGARGDQWLWRIRRRGNNEILASSELLNDRATAEHAVRLVRDDAGGNLGVWDQTGSGAAAWAQIP